MNNQAKKLIQYAVSSAQYRSNKARGKAEGHCKESEELERASYNENFPDVVRKAVSSVAKRKQGYAKAASERSKEYNVACEQLKVIMYTL